jgi:hypothetical protein
LTGPIHYFCSSPHTYALGIFQVLWAKDLAPHLKIISYPEVKRIRSFGPGVFIFSDFDRVPPPVREKIGILASHLAAHGGHVLNNPQHILGRYDLLRALHRERINTFNVYRLSDWREACRFPVFIRHENDHRIKQPELLPDKESLAQAVRALEDSGDDLKHLIIIEFGNVRCADGRFRKYSAFCVGREVYAADITVNDHWLIKYSNSESTAEDVEEDLRFSIENPHREQLETIFTIANVGYGRADYCVVDGRAQLFEINNNPTISHILVDNEAYQERYARRHEEALIRLLAEGTGPAEIPNPFFSRHQRETDVESVAKSVWAMRSQWENWWPQTRPGARGRAS